MSYCIGRKFGAELIDILRLPKGAFEFDMHVAMEDVVTITCKYYLDTDVEKLKECFQKYYVCEKKDESLIPPAVSAVEPRPEPRDPNL